MENAISALEGAYRGGARIGHQHERHVTHPIIDGIRREQRLQRIRLGDSPDDQGVDLGPLLEKKPPGVALLNRDYAEGKFKSYADGVAEMESVLFGKQTIQQAELRAIKVAKRVVKPARLMILTTSDSRILAHTVETVADGRLKIRDASGYHITVPAAQIRQIRFGSSGEK